MVFFFGFLYTHVCTKGKRKEKKALTTNTLQCLWLVHYGPSILLDLPLLTLSLYFLGGGDYSEINVKEEGPEEEGKELCAKAFFMG